MAQYNSSSSSSYLPFPSSSSSSWLPSSSTGTDAVTQLRENIQSEPFLQFNGLTNGTWFSFFIIAVASSRLGTIGPRFGLPLITAYMVVGCICGPYVLNLVTTAELPDIAYITQIALSFIAFSAGSELYLLELRSLFRKILSITALTALFSYTVCALFIYLLAWAGVVPWMSAYLGGCAVGISLIAASIMVARSPASAIAVVRELRAKGPVTSTMLGVTVVGDVVVLVLFTLSSSIALAQCSGGGFEGGAFLITLLTLVLAVGLGYLLGGLLIFLLWLPYARYSILPLGFITFVFSDWWSVYSLTTYGVSINFDSLLICITAGYVATNQSRNRVAFLKLLGSSASYIFIPFFTKVGVELNLTVLWQSLPFAALVFLMRLICIFLGSSTGGWLTGMTRTEMLFMWMTMLAQAGVSLGLASEVAVKFPQWGRSFQTTIIAVVLINQFAGPVACKFALKSVFKEAGRMKEGEEEHGDGGQHEEGEGGRAAGAVRVRRVLVVGVDRVALEVAQRLVDRGYAVTTMDVDKTRLALTSVLETEQPDIVRVVAAKAGAGDGGLEEGLGQAAGDVKPKGRKKRGRDEYAVLEPERQQSELVEQQEDEQERTVEAEEAEEAEAKEAEDDDDDEAEPVQPPAGSVLTEKRIDSILLPISASATAAPLDPTSASSASSSTLLDSFTSRVSPLLSSPLSNLHSALVFLPSDAETLAVCSLLTSVFHLHHVVARLHNDSWAEQARSVGVIPVSESSVAAHVISQAITAEDDDLDLTSPPPAPAASSSGSSSLPPPVSLPALFALWIAASDAHISHWAMSREERELHLSQHPAATEDETRRLTLSSLQSALTTPVSVNVVPVAMREDYLSSLYASSNAEDEGDVDREMKEATAAFLSPAAMREVNRAQQT